MGFAVIMGVKQARRTLQLVDYHPFRTVYHKDTVLGHQRQGTEKHFLLLDVPHRLYTGGFINIKGDQPNSDLNRYIMGHTPFNAFCNCILWFAKGIANKFEGTESVEIRDRKNVFKDGLQADIFSLVRVNTPLQETLVRIPLHGNKMRRLNNPACLGKTFSYSIHDPSRYNPQKSGVWSYKTCNFKKFLTYY